MQKAALSFEIKWLFAFVNLYLSMKFKFSLLLLTFALFARSQSSKYELVISHAKVSDVKSGNISNNQTLLIKAGKIVDIVSTSKEITGKRTSMVTAS